MKNFEELLLPEELLKALKDLNFVQPTKTQVEVTPLLREGRDVMVCAETGSGKTAAYGIPLVTKLIEDSQSHALVLAPTRELVHQISEFLRVLTAHCKQFRITSLVGGADMRKQLQALKRRPRLIVATPGRLIDHLKRGSLKLNMTRFLVLDEGDRMLDMGFAPQLDEIIKFLPKERQSSLFTATLPGKVQKLAETYLSRPEKVLLSRDSLPVTSIKQSVIKVAFKEKDDRLVDELNQRSGSVIVFARTKHRTDIIADYLKDYGFDVDVIHGGRTQGQRNKAIHNFRSGRCRILCATDIAARGIDVPQVEHVINYDLPMMSEDYVHRVGRTARNGATGEALSFVQPEEVRTWQMLVKKYQIVGADLQLPPGEKRSNGKSSRFGGKKKSAQGGKRPPFKKSGSFKSDDSSDSFWSSKPSRSASAKPSRSERPARSARPSRSSGDSMEFTGRPARPAGSGTKKKKVTRSAEGSFAGSASRSPSKSAAKSPAKFSSKSPSKKADYGKSKPEGKKAWGAKPQKSGGFQGKKKSSRRPSAKFSQGRA